MDILYLCDHEACERCNPIDCDYTTDIHHARNFHCEMGMMVELKGDRHESDDSKGRKDY